MLNKSAKYINLIEKKIQSLAKFELIDRLTFWIIQECYESYIIEIIWNNICIIICETVFVFMLITFLASQRNIVLLLYQIYSLVSLGHMIHFVSNLLGYFNWVSQLQVKTNFLNLSKKIWIVYSLILLRTLYISSYLLDFITILFPLKIIIIHREIIKNFGYLIYSNLTKNIKFYLHTYFIIYLFSLLSFYTVDIIFT